MAMLLLNAADVSLAGALTGLEVSNPADITVQHKRGMGMTVARTGHSIAAAPGGRHPGRSHPDEGYP